jgi:hypothetical protein
MQLVIRTSWDGITISDYMKYTMILEDPNVSDFEKNLRILALLCNIERETLNELPANQIVPLFNRMQFLASAPDSKPEPYYEINGRKFKLVMDVTQLTAGQFIDLNHYTKDAAHIIYNIHSICATLLLPVKEYRGKKIPPVEKYGESSTEERSEFLYEHMPIKEALGISSFFTYLYNLFTVITERYLKQERDNQLNLASKMLSRTNLNHLKIGSMKNGNG